MNNNFFQKNTLEKLGLQQEGLSDNIIRTIESSDGTNQFQNSLTIEIEDLKRDINSLKLKQNHLFQIEEFEPSVEITDEGDKTYHLKQDGKSKSISDSSSTQSLKMYMEQQGADKKQQQSTQSIKEIYSLYNWQIEDLQTKLKVVLTENQKLVELNETLAKQIDSQRKPNYEKSIHLESALSCAKQQISELQQKLLEAESEVVNQQSSELATVDFQEKKIEQMQAELDDLKQLFQKTQNELLNSQGQIENLKKELSLQSNQLQQQIKKEGNYKSNLQMQSMEQQRLLATLEEKNKDISKLQKDLDLLKKDIQHSFDNSQINQNEEFLKKDLVLQELEKEKYGLNKLLNDLNIENERLKKSLQNKEQICQQMSKGTGHLEQRIKEKEQIYENQIRQMKQELTQINSKIQPVENQKQEYALKLIECQDKNLQLSKSLEFYQQQIKDIEKISDENIQQLKQKYLQMNQELIKTKEQNKYLQMKLDQNQTEFKVQRTNEKEVEKSFEQYNSRKMYQIDHENLEDIQKNIQQLSQKLGQEIEHCKGENLRKSANFQQNYQRKQYYEDQKYTNHSQNRVSTQMPQKNSFTPNKEQGDQNLNRSTSMQGRNRMYSDYSQFDQQQLQYQPIQLGYKQQSEHNSNQIKAQQSKYYHQQDYMNNKIGIKQQFKYQNPEPQEQIVAQYLHKEIQQNRRQTQVRPVDTQQSGILQDIGNEMNKKDSQNQRMSYYKFY